MRPGAISPTLNGCSYSDHRILGQSLGIENDAQAPEGVDLPEIPTPVRVAAMWISTHEDDIRGPRIPFIRSKFDLSILDAVEASRLAHKLRYAGGR